MQQFFKFQVRAGTDQLDVETERLIKGFAANETEYLKVGGYAFEHE